MKWLLASLLAASLMGGTAVGSTPPLVGVSMTLRVDALPQFGSSRLPIGVATKLNTPARCTVHVPAGSHLDVVLAAALKARCIVEYKAPDTVRSIDFLRAQGPGCPCGTVVTLWFYDINGSRYHRLVTDFTAQQGDRVDLKYFVGVWG